MIEIYESIFITVGVGFLFACLFIFEPWGWVIDKLLPYKPFNCVLCLCFWCSLGLYIFIDLNPLNAIYSAVIAEMTYRKLIM